MNGKQLKNSILQWAIQGKLVPQDPNDEPASVLLERIRAEKARLVKDGKIKKDKNESIIFRGEDNSHYEKFPDGRVVCIDDEIPFEVPQGWEWCRLGYLFAHNTGKALNGSQHSGTLLPYITTSNLYWDRFELGSLREMYFTDSEIDKCTVTKGDLLVCEGGDIGRAAIWNKEESICIQNHIHRLRAYLTLETRFYFYIFLLYKGVGNIGGKGIGIQGLSSGALHSIIVPLPSIKEQLRIVQAIDSIMPILDRYERSQKKLDDLNGEIKKQLSKSILQEAIQGRLVPQDPADEPASALLERIRKEKQKLLKEGKLKKKDIVDSVIFKGEDNKYYEKVNGKVLDISDEVPFEIPVSWRWARLKSIAQILNGYAFRSNNYKSSGYRVIRITNVQDGYIVDNDPKFYSSIIEEGLQEYIINNGDLLMSLTGNVGRVGIITEDLIPAVLNQRVANIRLIPQGVSLQYLFSFFKTPHFVTAAISNSKGMAQKNMSTEWLKECLVPIPPINEQHRIFDRIQALKL